MRSGTLGQILINDALPEDLQEENLVLDKRGIREKLRQLAEKYPERYREVSHRWLKLGARVAQETGGQSFGLQHMRRGLAATKTRERLQGRLRDIINDDTIDNKTRNERIVKLVSAEMKPQQEAIYEEALKDKNPLALQVLSGSRGNKMNLASLLGSDLLYEDQRNNPIPVPILRSYAEGLSPEEYFSGLYGARKGTIATKFCLDQDELVLMADGSSRPIKDIRIGDEVLSLDRNKKLIRTKVTDVSVNGNRACYRYYFRNRRNQYLVSVTATPDHKIYIQTYWRSGAITTEMLPLGKCTLKTETIPVKTNDGVQAFIYVGKQDAGTRLTYDLEVDHPSHRFVLANLLVVSNSTRDSGFLGKQLNQLAHRLVVTDKDYEDEAQRNIMRGVPVDVDDPDNEGALLAQDAGPYKRNTPLTPKIIKRLSQMGKKRILIRSAMTGGSPEGGVYASDVGIFDGGRLPGRGTNVGMIAAQALSEPLSQGALSTKHSGGVAGESKTVTGFPLINQLVQVPKSFSGGAAHAHVDGKVQHVEEAPAGGHYITINNEKHYVAQGINVTVKKGDEVEAGDVLSDGIPNPAEIVKHKGIGEGRKYFVKAMRDAMQSSGMTSHRRNIELLSRGLINHVRLNQEYGSYVPDDVMPYSTLEHTWEPREGYTRGVPKAAIGRYLESPVLHYTIGTKVKPSMLKDLEEFGIKELVTHADPPPFEPEMIRGMESLSHDPDWMTRGYGSGLKKSLLDAVHRGSTSDEAGTSFVPSLAKAVNFGRIPGGAIKPPEPGYKPAIVEPEEETISVPSGKWFGGVFSPKH